jgi:hypothetical protein
MIRPPEKQCFFLAPDVSWFSLIHLQRHMENLHRVRLVTATPLKSPSEMRFPVSFRSDPDSCIHGQGGAGFCQVIQEGRQPACLMF